MAKNGEMTMWDRRQMWRQNKKALEEHVQRHDDPIVNDPSRGLRYPVHPLSPERHHIPERDRG